MVFVAIGGFLPFTNYYDIIDKFREKSVFMDFWFWQMYLALYMQGSDKAIAIYALFSSWQATIIAKPNIMEHWYMLMEYCSILGLQSQRKEDHHHGQDFELIMLLILLEQITSDVESSFTLWMVCEAWGRRVAFRPCRAINDDQGLKALHFSFPTPSEKLSRSI